MNFSVSLLSLLTFSVLGPVTSELSLLARGTKITPFKTLKEVLQKERESDHTLDLFCQMQTSRSLAFHPVWYLKSFPIVPLPKTVQHPTSWSFQ